MGIHACNKEAFGYLVAFDDGRFGLYDNEAAQLCAGGAGADVLEPHKLRRIAIGPDFHLRGPLVVWIELTRACNLRCRHCFVAADQQRSDEMPTERVLALLDELKALNTVCVVFTGGEPLLRRDFPQILDYACRLGFIISVVTNGFLLTDAVVRDLPRQKVRITVSLDNLHFGEATGDGRRLAYLQSRLLLLKQSGVACHVSATLTRQNLSLLAAIFVWLREQGIGFRTIPFTPIGRGAEYPELQLTTAQVKEAGALWAMELGNENDLRPTAGLTFSDCFDYALNLVWMARACKGGRFIAYIAANGDVYPCTTCAGCEAYAAGSIAALPFREIWETSLQEFRALSHWDNFEQCATCSLSSSRFFCTNRCVPLARLYHGHPFACGATPYDRASLGYRTKLLATIQQSEAPCESHS